MKVIIYNSELRFEFLSTLNDGQKKRILSINEDDKLEFKIIKEYVEKLSSHFPQYNRSYIVDVLFGTSMNIEKAYFFLKDPIRNTKLLFNDADDNLVLHMKGSSEYSALEKEKGSDRIREREDFLMG